MNLTSGNHIKVLYLLLFVASSILSLVKPSTHSVVIAGLSLVGFVAFDAICHLRDKYKVKDLGPELEALKAQVAGMDVVVKEIKNDHSVSKLANTFVRK